MGQSSETLIRASASTCMTRVSTSQPVPRILLEHPASGGDHASGTISNIVLQPIPLVNVVIGLLDRAAEAMDSDRAAARDCISRATALLQKDHDRASRECRDKTTTLARGGLAPWQMRQVIMHVDATLASTINTDDCAAIARLSTSHFRRAFKLSFGMTFYKYVYQRRVERAQEIMVTTDQTLCQIARRCGFADKSHFTRVFRRLVGPSPATWRRM